MDQLDGKMSGCPESQRPKDLSGQFNFWRVLIFTRNYIPRAVGSVGERSGPTC
jgi:hypothetical protein